MTTFCGCDTQSLADLSSVFGEHAARLRGLAGGTSRSARTVMWLGPDGDDFRDRAFAISERLLELFEALRELGDLLGEESAQQEICSQPDPAASGDGRRPAGHGRPAIGAELPWRPTEVDMAPQLSGSGPWPPGRMIGGPLAAKDPLALADRLPALPDLRDLAPMIGGPIIARHPLRPIPRPGPLPEGEEFALDPEHLDDAQKDRRVALGSIPFVGTAQMLMGVHDSIGRGLEGAQGALESSGLGFAAPAVSVLRIPHALSGIALGEKSVLGQVTSAVDRQIANVGQTTGEVSEAIGAGDWGAAVRAAERGAFRHVDASADVPTATAVPAVADAASEIAGSGADLLEPLSPHAAAPLRTVEEGAGRAVEDLEGLHDGLTDGERYYDLRRRVLPMPWDPRG